MLGLPREVNILLIIILLVISSQIFFLGGNREEKVEVSLGELEEYTIFLSKLVYEKDPSSSIQHLKETIKKDEEVSNHCHFLLHEIAHTSVEKYGTFAKAFSYYDPLCVSGYLHGIIEAFMGPGGFANTVKKECDAISEYFTRLECYHGMGHGFMWEANHNLTQSLSLCDKHLNNTFEDTCAVGVMMEYFFFNQSGVLNNEDIFYPCNTDIGLKWDCYYAWKYRYLQGERKSDYLAALKLCGTAEEEYQDSCVRGISGRAIGSDFQNIKLVESYCMQIKENLLPSCITGMIHGYLFSGQMSSLEDVCDELEESNREICRQIDVEIPFDIYGRYS